MSPQIVRNGYPPAFRDEKKHLVLVKLRRAGDFYRAEWLLFANVRENFVISCRT
jgi:hypothetical protein